MCGNPFKTVSKAVRSVTKSIGSVISAPLKLLQPKVPNVHVEAPTPPPPIPPAPPPPGQPAAPPTMDDGTDANTLKRRRGRSSLRIDLAAGNAVSGGTGLNVPKG